MARDMEFPPLVNWKSILKGIAGGSLIVGGLANPYGIIVQAILFLFGLLVLVDGVMVTGKGVFIVICLIAAVVFGALTLVVSMVGLGAPYLLVMLIIAAGLHYSTLAKLYRRMAGQSMDGRRLKTEGVADAFQPQSPSGQTGEKPAQE